MSVKGTSSVKDNISSDLELNLTVRALNPENEDELNRVLELAEQFHNFSDFKDLAFAHDKVKDLICGLAIQNNGYVGIGEIDGIIEGGMVCTAFAPYYSESIIVQDYGLFVTPSKRGGHLALAIMEDMSKWANEQGAKEIWLGITSGIANESAGALYEKLGFKTQGTVYRKVL